MGQGEAGDGTCSSSSSVTWPWFPKLHLGKQLWAKLRLAKGVSPPGGRLLSQPELCTQRVPKQALGNRKWNDPKCLYWVYLFTGYSVSGRLPGPQNLCLPDIESPSGDRIISSRPHIPDQTSTIWFLSSPGRLHVPDWAVRFPFHVPSAFIVTGCRRVQPDYQLTNARYRQRSVGQDWGCWVCWGWKMAWEMGWYQPGVEPILWTELKEKIPGRDEDSQGICLPPVSLWTFVRTFLNTCSTGNPGISHLAHKMFHKRTIASGGPIAGQAPRGSGIGNNHALGGVYRCESSGAWTPAGGKGIITTGINDDDIDWILGIRHGI